MKRPLQSKRVDLLIPSLKLLDSQGFVEYGIVDELKKVIETETGYPIDRTHFFKMIKEEMAYRYMDIWELSGDMLAAHAPGHSDDSAEYKESWYNAVDTIRLFMKGGSI